MKKVKFIFPILFSVLLFQQCKKDEAQSYESITANFGSKIDLNNLLNYESQFKPNYIVKDNTAGNTITNEKATLGRVLFYDKNLSIDNSVSCGSCHIQEFAFGDTALTSRGVSSGLTGRHSMRLVNARFSRENKFFWDERANTLEEQVTRPIQDHAEMGFSGQNGRPTIETLITKLIGIKYYNELFQFAYGNPAITEEKMQECLAQFVRSIQSFDSKYDAGRLQVANDNQPFPNFTAQENNGKNLFLAPPIFDATGTRTTGGLGCGGCHNAPEFDIAPISGNNGVIGLLNGTGIDVTNTRAPSLRDLINPNGNPNTTMMHTGAFKSLQSVIGHYGNINIAPGNTNLDPKLRPGGVGQKLNLTAPEVDAVIAFVKTLTGTNVYSDVKWSDPF